HSSINPFIHLSTHLRPMRAVVTAIHGILTSQTDPSWPDKFDAWMFEHDPEVKVLKKEYCAGPFPRWNCWVKDPLLARSLTNEIELFVRGRDARGAGGDACPTTAAAGPTTWFVAHSNGAVIALLTASRLIERGYKIGGLILTGAACEADIARNGILEWQSRGMLGSAIAYSSQEDLVLAGDARDLTFETRPSAAARLCSWLWGRA